MSSPPPRISDPQAFRILTRHFLVGLCRPRLLDDAGHEGLHRVLLGSAAGCLMLGLLMTRVFAIKYAALAGARGTPVHDLALLADTAFVLAIPMLVVAVLVTLEAEALFPDDVDYRICMVLPVKRSVVFQAKLAALALFIGGSVVVVHVALLPLLLLMHAGPGGLHVVFTRLLVLLVVGGLASLAALSSVVAVHGVVLACLPQDRRSAAIATVRSVLLIVLIALVPLVVPLSSSGTAIAGGSGLLGAVPPVWFVGLEQVLLGRADPALTRLAWRAAGLLAFNGAVAVAVYTWMYRRFDGPASSVPRRGMWRGTLEAWRRGRRRDAGAACGGVYPFTVATLWRSSLHQGVYVALAASGLGLAVQHGIASLDALLALPFVLVLLSCVALKSALSLPCQWRANWVFRQAERHASRPRQLRAVSMLFWRVGILTPLAVAGTIQAWQQGLEALVSIPVALVFGWLLVECLLRGWRRIPFTCSYLPGQRTMAHTALILLNGYLVFTGGGVLLSRIALAHPRPVGVILLVLIAAAATLRMSRTHLWKTAPLEFDAVPDDRPQSLGMFV